MFVDELASIQLCTRLYGKQTSLIMVPVVAAGKAVCLIFMDVNNIIYVEDLYIMRCPEVSKDNHVKRACNTATTSRYTVFKSLTCFIYIAVYGFSFVILNHTLDSIQ